MATEEVVAEAAAAGRLRIPCCPSCCSMKTSAMKAFLYQRHNQSELIQDPDGFVFVVVEMLGHSLGFLRILGEDSLLKCKYLDRVAQRVGWNTRFDYRWRLGCWFDAAGCSSGTTPTDPYPDPSPHHSLLCLSHQIIALFNRIRHFL